MIRRLLVLLGFVALAVFGFMAATPKSEGPDDPFAAMMDRSDEVRRERATNRARRDSLGGVSRAIGRTISMDLAARRVGALPAGLGAYHVSVDANVPAVSRDSFTTKIRAEFASLPAQARVPLRVFVVFDSVRVDFYDRTVVIPDTPDRPCVVIVSVGIGTRGGRPALPRPVDRVVGTCGFYARFGMPGAPMRDWLLETQGLSAISDEPASAPRFQPPIRLAGRQVAQASPIAACLAGADEPCTDAFFSGLGWFGMGGPYAEVSRGVFRASPTWANAMAFTVLARLRLSLGDERFGQLWRSPLSPAMAYENLEGRHIATFVRAELLKEFAPHRPGPLHAGLPLVLGVALGAGFGVWAIRRTPRDRS